MAASPSPASRSSSRSAPTCEGRRAPEQARGGARDRRSSATRCSRKLERTRRAVVRVRQRRGPGRRAGDRPALPTTAPSPARSPRSRCPRCSSAWSPAGAAPTCCPNLIGTEKALKVIIENPLSQNTHAQAGHRRSSSASPTRCSTPPTSWSESLRWAAARARGARPRSARRDRPARRDGTQAVGAAPVIADAQAARRGASAVPRARPDGGRHGQRDQDDGFAAEDEALADLIMSDELRAGLYAFDLVQKRARQPAGAPTRRSPGRSPRSASSAPA